MQLQITKNDIINKFPVESDISYVTVPYLSFNNEYFLNLELSQEANGSNFKINNKYFKVIQNLSNVLHLTDSFYKMSNVYPDTYRTMTTVPDKLDTSNVTSMNNMFEWCTNLITIPQLDTSNVTNMSGIFAYCESLTNVSQLDISNVTNMGEMFSWCTSLTTVPEFNTSKVTNMSRMFYYCTSLPSTFPWIIDCNSINSTDDIELMFLHSSVTKVKLSNVKQELRSQITSQLLKNDDTLEIIFVDADESKKNIKSIQSITKSVDYGTTFENIGLPNAVVATLDDDTTVDLPVTWNTASYISTQAGSQNVTGTVVLTDDLTNTNNLIAVANVTVAEQVIYPVNNNDWSLQFTLGTVESEVLFSNILGFSDKDTPSLEDFYGEDYDNQGRHLEIRYLGTQGNLTYAPDGVAVPNGCSSDEEVAAALNPDGIADYNPESGNIVFSGGSAGTKVYMLVYHSEPFNS